MPRVSADAVAAGPGRVRFESARTEHDPHSFAPERLDAAAERGTAGQRRVDEGKYHDREIQAGEFREHAEREREAPLLHRITGHSCDDVSE